MSAPTPPFPRHFNGKRFFNPGNARARGFLSVLRWQLTSRPERSPRFVHDVEPVVPSASVPGDEIRVTLVNHTTLLIQHRNVNILTDPVWSDRVSPFASIGPRRHRIPGVRFDDLPRIDIVLLSHNHYDHLDLATLRRLADRRAAQFIVPLGAGRLLRMHDVVPAHELDWGDSLLLPNVTIHCVPAQHFSGRGLFDRNRTLWCGYIVETPRRKIYFAGDTGFGDHFLRIRQRFGKPRVALLPIGAYEPRWFMAPMHMSPGDAARAHEIIGAPNSIATHHGTFQLADEAIDTPSRALRECAPESFLVLDNGQSVSLP